MNRPLSHRQMNYGWATGFRGWLCAWFLLVFSGAWIGLRAAEAATDFEKASQLYAQGKFEESAAAYQAMLQAGFGSGEAYYNLGNALFKSGQVGRAIAAYRQALLFLPRDPDLRANLRFARQQAGGGNVPRESWLGNFLASLTINEWTLLAVACWWCWLGLSALGCWRVELAAGLSRYVWLSGLLAACTVGGMGARLYQLSSNPMGVIVAGETAVRYGPLPDSKTLCTLADGTEVIVLEQREQWVQVRDSARRDGWIPRENIVTITGIGAK